MLRALTAMALALALSTPAAADVLVELSPGPLPALDRSTVTVRDDGAAAIASDARPKANTDGYDWYVPRFLVDRRQVGDTTLLAIRAPGSVTPCADTDVCSFNVEVNYYDTHQVRQHVDRFDLSGHQVQTINVRDVPGLAVDPDGFARGTIRVSTALPMNVDYFQVDTSQNFATGGEAIKVSELCATWAARFLTFGPGQGTVLAVFVRAPRGAAASDPPTVTGTIYDEGGNLVNSFTVRTDESTFDLAVQDLVIGTTRFGTVELSLFDARDDGGIVGVSHRAENRFSIGARAFCDD